MLMRDDDTQSAVDGSELDRSRSAPRPVPRVRQFDEMPPPLPLPPTSDVPTSAVPTSAVPTSAVSPLPAVPPPTDKLPPALGPPKFPGLRHTQADQSQADQSQADPSQADPPQPDPSQPDTHSSDLASQEDLGLEELDLEESNPDAEELDDVADVGMKPAVMDFILVDEGDGEWELRQEMWKVPISFLGSLTVNLVVLISLALFSIVETRDESSRVVRVLEVDVSSASASELETMDYFETDDLNAAAFARTDPDPGMEISQLTIDDVNPDLLETLVRSEIEDKPLAVEGPEFNGQDAEDLLGKITHGGLGEPRFVVDNYNEVLDRITQEILMLLEKRKLMVVWCFDQSGSMKDDQQQIRDRLDRVYSELGEKEAIRQQALVSAVTSYGEGFMVNTQLGPTTDVSELRDAIDSIPKDLTGTELLCQAIGKSMASHHRLAAAEDRQMAIFVVTDESGEPADNFQNVEAVIAQAKSIGCRVYFIGREAVFGYPKTDAKWVHPENGREYWMPIDRGPEGAFIVQLQTDGFKPRTDNYPSGFGPYEQSRIARETGGIFFMLPSTQTKNARQGDRAQQLKVMRKYRPDLRPRQDIADEIQNDPLRAAVWKIVNDLNPYRKEVADVMQVRLKFSADPAEFVRQVEAEKEKAANYLAYLNAAAKTMKQLKPLREKEESPVWQANYDLTYAQVVAYAARTYEYVATLDEFVRSPPQVLLQKKAEDGRPGELKLVGWNVEAESLTVRHPLTEDLATRSTAQYKEILAAHKATPWAGRAQWELLRGYGVELTANYKYIPTPPPPKPNPPKLVVNNRGNGGSGNGGNSQIRRPKPNPKPAPKPVVPVKPAIQIPTGL
jgi:hypothetical protein